MSSPSGQPVGEPGRGALRPFSPRPGRTLIGLLAAVIYLWVMIMFVLFLAAAAIGTIAAAVRWITPTGLAVMAGICVYAWLGGHKR